MRTMWRIGGMILLLLLAPFLLISVSCVSGGVKSAGEESAFVRIWDEGREGTVTAIACDAAGGIYCAGFTESSGKCETLLLKYESSGTLLWAKSWGTKSRDVLSAVAVDSAGNVYAAGGTQCDYEKSQGDALLLKYSSSGKLEWALTWATGWDDSISAIAIDTAGNIRCGENFHHASQRGASIRFLRRSFWGNSSNEISLTIADCGV